MMHSGIEWASAMNTWQTALITLATAALGLCTAWINYRAASRRGIENRLEQLDVLRLINPAVSITYWNIRNIRRISVIFGSIWLFGLLIAALIQEDRIQFLIVPIMITVVTIIISFTYRTKPPSRVYRRAELEIVADSATTLQRCIEAITVLRGQIAKIDGESEPKVVVSRTRMTWRSWGCIVSLTVSSPAPDRSHLLIESDSIVPAVVFDWGENSRNIR